MGTSSEMSTSNQYIKYKITINQNWQSTSENYSNVTVTVNFYRTNTGYTSYGNGTVYCKIDGTTYTASVSTSQKITNSGIDLFSKTLNIYHNNDGTKTLTCSAWISHDVFSSGEQSYSQTLSTIPRASKPTLSASSVTMGDYITIYTNRASSSFTHVLYYQIGSGGWNTIGTGIETSRGWTVPIDFANSTPNSTSLNVVLWLETYSGNTYIGCNSISLTANVPSSVVPTIGDITLTEAVSGIAEKFGGFVQWKSKIKASINAWGSYSSSIKSYSTKINGATYTSSSFTTDYLRSGGDCAVTVKDSRGRSKSKTIGFSATDYWDPWIDTFSVSRCNADGTANDSGNCAKCVIKAGIAPVNDKNDKSFTIQYKKQSESSYQTVILSNDNYTLETTQIFTDIDTESEYEFVLNVSDYFTTSRLSRNISTAYTLMDFRNTGRGIAFGRVSTKDQFEVNMDILCDKWIRIGESTNARSAIVFTNLAAVQGKTYESDGIYPHDTGILGGEGSKKASISVYDYKNRYSPLWYNDTDKKIYYGTEGLHSPNSSGIYFDKWGNVNTKTTHTSGDWHVANNGTQLFTINWSDKRIIGYYDRLYQCKWLYNNTNGTTGTVTLNDSASNYDIIDIIFRTNDWEFSSTRVSNPNGKTAILTGVNGGSNFYFKNSSVYISGKTIKFNKQWEMAVEGSINKYTGSFAYIVTVLGLI